jgi:hypothetical protein
LRAHLAIQRGMLKYDSIVNKFYSPLAAQEARQDWCPNEQWGPPRLAEFSANDRRCACRCAPLTKFQSSSNSSDHVSLQKAPESSTHGSVTAAHQQVAISFFFEDAPGQSSILDEPCDYVSGFLATSGGLALTKAYMQIENAKLRRSIVALVKQIAGEDEPEQVTVRII